MRKIEGGIVCLGNGKGNRRSEEEAGKGFEKSLENHGWNSIYPLLCHAWNRPAANSAGAIKWFD
jgi:hypothetical protein